MVKKNNWKKTKTYSGLSGGVGKLAWISKSNPVYDRIIQINKLNNVHFISYAGKQKKGSFVFVDKLPGALFTSYDLLEKAKKKAIEYMKAHP